MTEFPEHPNDDYPIIDLADTDRPLPKQINQKTRYAYFKTIAKGGKSLVQSCRDMHLGRVVCLKKLRPECLVDPVEQVRFLREARVTAMLQHPNIVPTYEVGRDNAGDVFFTMKLVHGYTLREVLDYRDRYDLRQLIDVIIQVAHALDYAHAHRVVHRDIKPENILVGRFGEVLLLDWGLAKVWGQDDPLAKSERGTSGAGEAVHYVNLTGQGKLQGTLAYMSPEQVRRDQDIDYRTDVYSLGVILFELLSGQPLMKGKTIEDLSQKILTGAACYPGNTGSLRVPSLLNELTYRCLALEPENRVASCGEIVRLLNEEWD